MISSPLKKLSSLSSSATQSNNASAVVTTSSTRVVSETCKSTDKWFGERGNDEIEKTKTKQNNTIAMLSNTNAITPHLPRQPLLPSY